MIGLWVGIRSILSSGGVDAILPRLRRGGITDVFVELHGATGAIYNTTNIPKLTSLGNFDSLAAILQRWQGVRIHGWYHVGWWNAFYPQYDINHHEGVPGVVSWSDFGSGFSTLASVIVDDILLHYPALSGIHLDAARFPGPETGFEAARLFSSASVTDTVKAIRNAVGARATLTAAVRRQGWLDCLQDWPGWIDDGLFANRDDRVIPMCYRDKPSKILYDFAAWDPRHYSRIAPGVAVIFEKSGEPLKTTFQFREEFVTVSSGWPDDVVIFDNRITDDMLDALARRPRDAQVWKR
jgi:hypothetical protein